MIQTLRPVIPALVTAALMVPAVTGAPAARAAGPVTRTAAHGTPAHQLRRPQVAVLAGHGSAVLAGHGRAARDVPAGDRGLHLDRVLLFGPILPAHAHASRAAQSPEQRAHADAKGMLARFVPPPGAVRSAAAAAPALAAVPERPATKDLVMHTKWWRVSDDPLTVLTWLGSHPPAGFTRSGTGTATGTGGAVSYDEFTKAPVPGVLSQRTLLVSVAKPASAAVTGSVIRVDAQVVWLPPKPAAERVPATARVVRIVPVAGSSAPGRVAPDNVPVPGSKQTQRASGLTPTNAKPAEVTDPGVVAQIAKAIDQLPLFPPGVTSCPLDLGRAVQLTFRSAANGPVVAEVTAHLGGCQPVTLKVGDKQLPALRNAAELVARVLKMVGLSWPGY